MTDLGLATQYSITVEPRPNDGVRLHNPKLLDTAHFASINGHLGVCELCEALQSEKKTKDCS